MNILLTGGHSSLNNGEAAMVVSTVQLLRVHFPDVRFTIYSRRPQIDSERYHEIFKEDANIEVIGLSSRWQRALSIVYFPSCAFFYSLIERFREQRMLRSVRKNRALNAFSQADLVVDLSGDSFTDDYGAISTIIHSAYVITAILFRRRTVIFAQSMGPFRNTLTKSLARFMLKNVDLILLRERITLDLLVNLGISEDRLHLTADSAFLLPKVCSDRVKKLTSSLGKPLIGFNVSRLATKLARGEASRSEDVYLSFIQETAEFADRLIDALNCYVVLIPHRFGPGEERDDRVTLGHIYQVMESKKRTTLLTEAYTPMEIKSIVGECDLFIGARMHSNIAALSQGIPTVAISYSHKTLGIMDMLGVKEWVYYMQRFDPNTLLAMCEEAFQQREQIKAKLDSHLPQVIASSRSNAEAVARLISGDSSNQDNG